MILRLLHRLSERFGWATGTIETWWDGGELMVGFKCSCGDLRDISLVAGFDRGPWAWGEFPDPDIITTWLPPF